MVIPNVLLLFRGLLGDPQVPWHAKAVLGAGVAYLAFPIDIVPDFIPVLGQADDAVVAALVLGYVARAAGRDAIVRHWRGDPTLIRRLLREPSVSAKVTVLFLCIANSARSQMAEGLLRSLGGDRYDVHSAGLTATAVRPDATLAMREVGIDISAQRSKTADEYAGRPFDIVVTTCDEAKEACPLFPGAERTIHWSIPDPAGRGLPAFRAARDQLREMIERDLLGGGRGA